MEVNDVMHTKMIQKEYYRRVIQLNGGNTIRAINSQAVSLVRYSAVIPKWTKDEVNVMDRKTKKIMIMNRMYLHRVTLTNCTFQEWKVDEYS